MTTAPQKPAASGPGITSLIPARIGRLPWSRFRAHLVAALGAAWTRDGLQITIAGNAGPDLGYACNTGAVAGLTQAAIREGLGLHAAGMDLSSRPSAGAAGADFAPVDSDAAALAVESDLGRAEPDRVLRYLPTHMAAPQIAAELYVSANTVKTHLRHVYRKLGAHSRQEAVQRARAIGLLAVPSGRRCDAGRPDGPEHRKADKRPAQIISLPKEAGHVR